MPYESSSPILKTGVTPSPNGKASSSSDYTHQEQEYGATDNEQHHVVEVKSSVQTSTPARPAKTETNEKSGGGIFNSFVKRSSSLLGGNNNNQQNSTKDSPSRHSNDSSMNYHRASEQNDGTNSNIIPLRGDGDNNNDENVNGGNNNYGSNNGGDQNGNSKDQQDNLYYGNGEGEDASLIPSPVKEGGDGGEDSDPNSPGDDIPEEPLEHHKRVNQLYKRAIFATIPVFMAYASMITLQRSIKEKIGITNENKDESDLFGVAVGNLYLGNLIFRLLHNVLFSFMIPRQRTMLSYTVLCVSHLIIGVAYWVFNSKSLVWTFIAYLLAGVGIGTFESNVLSCLSPLGHGTKSWAVIGIPIGFNGVSVGFYIIFAIEPHLEWLKGFPYFFIAVCNILGLFFFIYGIPYVEFEASHDNVVKFKEDICRWNEWLPRVRNYCLALCADMFCVSMFSAIVYYIYNVEDIPIYPYAEKTIPKNVFQVWYNFCSFLGDFSGRKIAYRDKHKRNPFYFLFFSLAGIAMIMSKVVILAPFGMFCIMFANGSIYAHTTKHIDNVVDDRFILVALSVWLFVGDIGSYSASLIVQPLQLAVGPVPEPYHAPTYNNTLPNWWGNVTEFPTMTTVSSVSP